ncbi:MAG: low molecular weight protein arginine phosphatase [Caldilineaceae bacterium]|nr:low molecular weight protein arginine phosphatase [Caldilineaceae bacterium]
MPSVLFVCTANQCRSPMAEALFRDYLASRKQLEGWTIGSAGTWGVEDVPATRHVQTVMANRGIDVSAHRSRLVDGSFIYDYNLLLTMERGHKEALQIEFPRIASRVFLLSEMIGKLFEISDPIRGPYEEYEATAAELEELIKDGAPRIFELAAK